MDLQPFDYNALDDELGVFLFEKTDAIRWQMKTAADAIFEVGQMLSEVRARLMPGQFVAWLKTEFEMTARTAYHYMDVADRLASRMETVSNLPARALYELAAPSTPDVVIDAIVEQVASGQLESKAVYTAIRAGKALHGSPPLPPPAVMTRVVESTLAPAIPALSLPVKPSAPMPEPEEEAPDPEPENVIESLPVTPPAPVARTGLYPLDTYNQIMAILARLYPTFTEEVIAAGIHAATQEDAAYMAHAADLWQQRFAYLRGQVKKRTSG